MMANGLFQRWHNNGGMGVGIVIDAFEAKAEQTEETRLVALEVAKHRKVFGIDAMPAFIDEGLDIVRHFPIVDADAAGIIGLRVGISVKALAEHAVHLLDGVFVGAFGLHYLVEQGDVEWDDRDCGARLGDEGFVDRDPRLAVYRSEPGVECALGAFKVFFGSADGAVFIDRPGDFGADVGVGDSGDAGGENPGFVEGVDPHFPVLATHHGDGLPNVVAIGGRQGDLVDDAGGGVEVFVGKGLTDRFEHGFVGFSGIGIGAARRSEAVDDAIDLAEVCLDGVDDGGLHFIREGVTIEGSGVKAGGVGFAFESGGVIPTGSATTIFLAGFFEEDAEGRGIAAEGCRDA